MDVKPADNLLPSIAVSAQSPPADQGQLIVEEIQGVQAAQVQQQPILYQQEQQPQRQQAIVSASNNQAAAPTINDKKIDKDSNILVAIRVRPLNQKEENNGDQDVIRVEDKLMIVLDPVEMDFLNENKKMLDVYHRSKEQRYAFDKIFRHQSQEEVYQQTCRHLIKPVIQGFNATVFAYGPTGTGKTYTMLGYQDTPGLCALTIQDMFQQIKKDQDNNEYSLSITYVEIYNETIRDLLVPHSTYLELRDDPLKGITIAGVTESKAESTEQVMNLLFIGNRRRTTESTNANMTSSRSHAVFQVTVTSTPKTKNTEQENRVGKLSLIDLAGSERGTVTENRGIRLREGAKINQSLLALANCINALGDKAKKGFFVPYRDSKLTRMLKDSLGGNCKTVMIANVSPSGAQFEETINTLKYANRAKNIKTKVSSNKRLVSVHIAEYKNIISDLRSEIEQLKAKLHDKIGDNNDILHYQEEEQGYLEKQHLNQLPGINPTNCVCGRQEEEAMMRGIQEEIFENFQNRIQLRRGLMEIEEQNAMNVLEIKRKQADILIWKRETQQKEQNQQQGNKETEENSVNQNNSINNEGQKEQVSKQKRQSFPEEILQTMKAVRTLKVSTEKNSIRKEMMTLSLIENIANAKEIRDKIPKQIKFQDKRNYLELVIKNHVLELQNIEMEINLQIQEKTIGDLKNIIEQQRKIIGEQDGKKMKRNLSIDGDDNSNKNNNGDYSENDVDQELQDMIVGGEYEEEDDDEIDNEMVDDEDEDEEDINDMVDLQDILEKQKEQVQLNTNSITNIALNEGRDNKRDEFDNNNNNNKSNSNNNIPNNLNNNNNNNKRSSSSRSDCLPEINPTNNTNQSKNIKPNSQLSRHASKHSQDNVLPKNFSANEDNMTLAALQETDENASSVNAGVVSTPKINVVNAKAQKKESIHQPQQQQQQQLQPQQLQFMVDGKKKGNQQQQQQQQQIKQPINSQGNKKKEQIFSGGGYIPANNNLFKDISITGQSAIPLQKDQGNISQPTIIPQSNQGMPLISRANGNNNQQAQKDKDFSGLNLKGKNFILPSLSNQSNLLGAQNPLQIVNAGVSGSSTTTNNNGNNNNNSVNALLRKKR